MSGKWYIIDGVNPQPWAIGPLGMARKGAKNYPYVGPNRQLVTFQNAVKEHLKDVTAPPFTGEVALEFYLWRKIEQSVVNGRKRSGHIADSTNLQKALEDALQGFAFTNDRLVRDVRTVVVEQLSSTTPRIAIKVSPWVAFNPDDIPASVWGVIDEQPTLFEDSPNTWGRETADVF